MCLVHLQVLENRHLWLQMQVGRRQPFRRECKIRMKHQKTIHYPPLRRVVGGEGALFLTHGCFRCIQAWKCFCFGHLQLQLGFVSSSWTFLPSNMMPSWSLRKNTTSQKWHIHSFRCHLCDPRWSRSTFLCAHTLTRACLFLQLSQVPSFISLHPVLHGSSTRL